MAVHLRKKQTRVLPFRLTLWALVAVVVVAVLLEDHKLTFSADDDLSEGVSITRETDSDVTIVLDYQAIRESDDSFSGRDFSAAWITMVEREIGPASIATPETLSQELLDNSRVLILTHSVSTDLPSSLLQRIREHVLDGNVVVIERPDGEAREMFSASGDAGHRRGRVITHADAMASEFAAGLEQMPVLADYIGSTSPRDNAQTLLAIDGAPVIYAAEFGSGKAITVDFDLGRQWVTLQQGLPDEDFTVPRDGADLERSPRTSDLVADDSLLGAKVPYATLLERFFVYGVLMRYSGVPALWLFPDGAAGAVVFAHEDDTLGDGAAWPLDYERRRGASSTLLSTFDSGLTPEGAADFQDRGGHIGLAWRSSDPSVAVYEYFGFFGYRPFQRPVDLDTQRSDLGDVVPFGSIRTSRSIEGLWSSHWTEPLAALAAVGIRTDVSFETPTHRGYAFGSGLPFQTISHEGMPLGIREYPVVVPADAKEGPAVEELLTESAEGYHQLITVATRPSAYADYPDMDRFEEWLSIFDHAAAHGHRMMNIADFEGFQRLRRSTTLRSRLDRRARLPEDLQSSQTGPDHRAVMLRIVADTRRRGMYLHVPRSIGDAEFFAGLEGTERVGSEIVTSELDPQEFSMTGFPVYRVRLREGFNNIELYYR